MHAAARVRPRSSNVSPASCAASSNRCPPPRAPGRPAGRRRRARFRIPAGRGPGGRRRSATVGRPLVRAVRRTGARLPGRPSRRARVFPPRPGSRRPGVFSSWEAFATKSRRTASRRRASVTSPTTTTTDPSAPAGVVVTRSHRVGDPTSNSPTSGSTGLRHPPDGLPQARREHLAQRLRTGPEVPLDGLVRERGAPAAVEQQHAFLHGSEDPILNAPLLARRQRARLQFVGRAPAGFLEGAETGPRGATPDDVAGDSGDHPGRERAGHNRRAHRTQCRGHLSCGFASTMR